MDKAKLLQMLAGALARFVVVFLMGYLLARKTPVLSLVAEYLKNNENSVTVEIAGVLLTLGSLVWSLVNKWLFGKAINTAAALPAGLTPKEIQAEIKAESLPAVIPATEVITYKQPVVTTEDFNAG